MQDLSNPRPATWRAATALAGALAVCGCSGPESGARPTSSTPETPVVAATQDSAVSPDPGSANGATTGGDGSEIRLAALSPADVEAAALSGELACSFSTPEAAPLLVAKGNAGSDAPAQGVVKVLDSVERVATPGGFNAIVNGATLKGRGKTLRVTLTGPAIGGGESPPRPATLTYERADGASRTFAGRWLCGP